MSRCLSVFWYLAAALVLAVSTPGNCPADDDDWISQFMWISLDDCPADKQVSASLYLVPVSKPNLRPAYDFASNDIYNGSGLIGLRARWIAENEKETFRLFVIPNLTLTVFEDHAPHELTWSAMSGELTLQQVLAHCTPCRESRNGISKEEKAQGIAKAYRFNNVTWYRFLKTQTVRLLDADGDPVATDAFTVGAKFSGPVWDEWIKVERNFDYMLAPRWNLPFSFRVYSGLEYHLHANYRFAGEGHTFPDIAAEELAKLNPWQLQYPFPTLHIRLLDAETKQTPAVFSELRRHPRLMVSPTKDTPKEELKRIDIWEKGTSILAMSPGSGFENWKEMHFHAVTGWKKDKEILFKPLTKVYKFAPGKKVHHVDILIEPVDGDTALTPETTVNVTDKKSGKAVDGVAVYTLTAPQQAVDITKPLPLKPGKHQLLFYAEGYRLSEQEVTVHGEGKHTETVALEPLPAPVTLAFNGPADAPADKLQLKFRYDKYPFLGTLKLTRVNWKDGATSVPEAMEPCIFPKLTLDKGRGEMPVAIDGRQPFTLCANAMPKPQPGMRSGSQELPLLVFRHPADAPECARAELKLPACVEWKGKIDLKAAGAEGAVVVWARKLGGIPDTPVAGATRTADGECRAFLEPGQTYGRYLMLMGKDFKGNGACRSLAPYTVPADAKELPEETLVPGPAGSGVPVRDKIGGWMF